MRNLPFHDLTQNRVWLAITALAHDLLAWTQRLALTGRDRPIRTQTAAAAHPRRRGRLVRTARRTVLEIPDTWPWAHEITTAHTRLDTLTP